MIKQLLPALILNAVTVIAIVELIYRRYNKLSGYYIFTFYTFSVLMVFISALLRDVELSVGVGFGLFAIFSLLRYRTEIIPLKQMTYIFVFITIPFMNTLYLSSNFTLLVIVLNVLVVLGISIAEITASSSGYSTKRILYNELDLLKPEKSNELITDLNQKTGLDIQHVEFDEINLVRQTARLTIFYRDKQVL